MAKAVEPPPRPRRDVADRAGTLQGQLRALARQTLTHSRSSTSASGGRGEAAEVDATRVTRLQRRALEVLLRMDKDVEVKEPSSAEERAEANSLRLGAALLRMRGKGHGDAADLLEGLHDAFTRRRSAYLPRVPFAVGAGGPHPAPKSDRHHRDGSERPSGFFVYDGDDRGAPASNDAASTIVEHASVVSLLLELAGTGGTGGTADAARSAFAHLAATQLAADPSISRSFDDDASYDDEPDVRTAAAARAARAGDWLRLAPASELEATPSLSFASTRPSADDGVFNDATGPNDSTGLNDSASFDLAKMSRALEATPGVGALSFGTGVRGGGVNGAGFADPFSFASRPDRSLFGAPARSGGRGEGGAPKPADEPRTTSTSTWTTGPPRSSIDTDVDADADMDAEVDPEGLGDENDDPNRAWLAAAEDGERGEEVLGWDLLPEARPACGAFMSRPPDAFGRAYDRHLLHVRTMFGGAKPAVAAEEEVVHAARRALAGGRAAAEALDPERRRGGDRGDASKRAPLRLPAAGVGVVAATLGPLADAATMRAELESFLARRSGFGGHGECTGGGLALQAASEAVRGVLRSQTAAIHSLPAAAAARRAAERAAGAPLSAPYRRDEKEETGDDSSGVTLLEAVAHTRRLRSQLASLHRLCLHPEEPADGVEFIARLVDALSAGGVNPAARPLLRYLAAATSRPLLAQLECWLHRADVDDPHDEFIVCTAPGWGSAAAGLEYSPAEAGVMEWSEARSSGAARARLEEEEEETDGPVDPARLPPWEGGPPGRAGAGHGAAEAAWLRDDDSRLSAPHPLLGGLERKVLATGVQLRVLQRLPQTQAFAVRMSASVDDHGPNTSLAFTAAELAAYSSRRGKTTRSLRAAAEECVSAMASTRDAAAARTEAARRARRAAAIARKLERESAVAEAREELLSGFADRMAELVARHERLRWQRKRRALGERRAEELESRTKRDERMVREELAKELAARRGGEEGVASKEPIVDPKEPILDPKDPIVDTSIASTDGGFERYDSPAARRAALDAGDAGDAGSTPGTGATNYFDDVADESFITAASDSSPVRNLAADLTGVNLDDSAIVDEDAPEEPPAVDEPKAEDTGGTSFEPSTSPARGDGLEVPFPVVLRECVEAVVTDRHDVVSRLVVAAMLDHLGVEAHLGAVGRYVLCGAGDFATALVQGLEATSSSSAALAARARASRMGVAGYGGGVGAGELRTVLDVAVRETSVFGDPLAQRFELAPAAPPDPDAVFSEHSLGMVDFVRGSYRLEWPVALLLPDVARTRLAAAQRSILRVRHARLALQEAHDRVHEAGHVDASSLATREGGERGRAGRALALRRLRRLSLLSSEFRHFASAVESQVGGAVHGAAPAALHAALRRAGTREPKPSDLYQLRDVIVAYATDAHDACLLSARDAPLRSSVDEALQLALDFRAAMRRSPPDRLLSDGGVYAAVQAIHARFKATTGALCGRLREAAADPGGALGGVSPERAAALLARLDFNGFYLGDDD